MLPFSKKDDNLLIWGSKIYKRIHYKNNGKEEYSLCILHEDDAIIKLILAQNISFYSPLLWALFEGEKQNL